MKYLLTFFLSSSVFCQVASFEVIILDRNTKVISPPKAQETFTVRVDNQSMTNIIGKFHAGGKDLKFVSVKSLAQKVVEIQNPTKKNVIYTQMSPAFQDVVLEFGKKEYEIPQAR
jgi:hypothetical protein